MIFSNPYFVALIFVMGISLIYSNYMDGQPMPRRDYSFNQALVASIIQFALIFGAVYWAATH